MDGGDGTNSHWVVKFYERMRASNTSMLRLLEEKVKPGEFLLLMAVTTDGLTTFLEPAAGRESALRMGSPLETLAGKERVAEVRKAVEMSPPGTAVLFVECCDEGTRMAVAIPVEEQAYAGQTFDA